MLRREFWRRTGAVAALCCLGSTAHAELTRTGELTVESKAAIIQKLEEAVQRGDAPGVVALVVDRDGALFELAAGKSDVTRGTPMRTDAIFNIASMTKPVTSVAIMQLYEQGKIKLDDPVSKYLPGFDKLQVITRFNEADGTVESRPAKNVMTIRQLLSHTSGIGYGFSSPIITKLQKPGQSEWELPLLQEPGTKWSYGASTRVLGMIVEKLSGMTLEEYHQKNILQPLGMRDTSFAVPVAKQSRVPLLQQREGDKLTQQPPAQLPATPPVPARGDGGLYSTARDYGRFIRMFLNGGKLGDARVLSEKSVRMMGQNQIGAIFVGTQPVGVARLTKPFPLGAGHDKFGLGFQIAQAAPGSAPYRSPGSMSWAGLFNTEFWIDPQQHVGGVLLMQVLPFYDDGAIRTLREFEAAVYKELR